MNTQNIMLMVLLIAILGPILYYIVAHMLIPIGLVFKMRSNASRSGGRKNKYLK